MTEDNDLAPVFERFTPRQPAWVGCGTGWNRLLLALDADLARLDPTYRIVHVKHSFGHLRFRTTAVPEDVAEAFQERIREAESASVRVCEMCGQPGVRTRCAEHHGVDTECQWQRG